MSQRQTWDIGRFFQTITYFEILPIIGSVPWLRRTILGENAAMTQPDFTPNPPKILIASTNPTHRQELINQLRQNNYQVRVVSSPQDKDLGGDGIEYSQADLQQPQSLDLNLFKEIKAVIYAYEGEAKASLEKLVQLANLSLKSQDSQRLLFDFRNASEEIKQIWGAVDDVVMGGVSESGLRLGRDTAIFTGNVSTANSGGFASVRNRNFEPPLDLSAYEGIQLRVKGDGKRYKCILRCEGKWDGISYCYSFDTIANTWITVRVPFAQLRPVFRAKSVPEADPLDTRRIYSIQLMLSKFEYDGGLNPKFEPGFFALEIETIDAYGGELASQFIVVNGTPTPMNETLFPDPKLHYNILNCGEIRENGGNFGVKTCSPEEIKAITPKAAAQACIQLLKQPEMRDRVFNICESDRATDEKTLFP